MDKQMQNRWLSLVIAVTFITAMLVFGFLAEPPRSEAARGESAPALDIQFSWKSTASSAEVGIRNAEFGMISEARAHEGFEDSP